MAVLKRVEQGNMKLSTLAYSRWRECELLVTKSQWQSRSQGIGMLCGRVQCGCSWFVVSLGVFEGWKREEVQFKSM